MAEPEAMRARSARTVALAVAISAGVAVAVPLAQQWEGFRGRAYLDPSGILTQCYGETSDVDPSLVYSEAQCATRLRTRMARDYAPQILACIPSMERPENRFAFGALIDAAYNAGPAAVCRSPMAKAFNAGRYRAGCEAFGGWYISSRDRRSGKRVYYRGLAARRIAEESVCLRGLA